MHRFDTIVSDLFFFGRKGRSPYFPKTEMIEEADFGSKIAILIHFEIND